MDWEDLRFVLAVTRTGSLSGAGAELGVARTTVGRRVEGLEESLGVRLFDRTPDGFAATPAGRDLADVAASVEDEILAVHGRVLGRDAELAGALRVSTVDFLYASLLDVFTSFVERYPGIDLTVCSSYDEVSLRRRDADVALRLSNSPPSHLVGRRLGAVGIGLYASRELAETVGIDAPLCEFPWLGQDERSNDRAIDAWVTQNVPGAKVAMRLDSYPTVLNAIIAGVGIFFMPCLDADLHPELVRLPGPGIEVSREVWALTLAELRTNSRVRAFMDHVYEATRERPGLSSASGGA